MRHPARPPRGTPEQRAWVVAAVRAWLAGGGHATRDAFVASQPSAANGGVTKDDVDDAALFISGSRRWSAVLDEARGEPMHEAPAIEIDVSELDYDDLGDTARAASSEPRHLVDATPAEMPARTPEPRELLDLQRTRAELAETKRRLADALEALHHADKRAGVTVELGAAPEPRPILRREVASGMREATAVVLASDWHLEEMVDPRAIEGRNAYSPEIARARAERMTEGVLWLLAMHRERFAVRDLVLWLGGDLISGYLHDELEETNELTPIEATLFAHDVIGGMIRTLLDRGDLERLIIPCNVGNHGRTTKKTRAKTRVQNSYEYLIYRHLEGVFRDEPRAQFTIAGGAHTYLRCYDRTIRFHHGDDVSYGGGIGGITIPINKAIASWQKFRHADLTCIGHFHQLLHGGDFVVNGSLVGYNEFALRIKAPYEAPQQAFFLMDSRRGRCCATPLWVDDESESRRAA